VTRKLKMLSTINEAIEKALKTNTLSILALAHTPKRDQHNPITKNDLQGSKMLITFVFIFLQLAKCKAKQRR